LEPLKQFQDLLLDRDVQRAGGLIRMSSRGWTISARAIATLALSARKLMG
jgi:hypothetical protein